MIFVTVGTHEQPFNRLIKTIDILKGQNKIMDDVFIQIGYSTYIPKHCQYKRFISQSKMECLIKMSTIVITHGGPSSFIEALKQGKMPIVIPRQKKFNEHVNNHQLLFCKELQKRGFPIKVVISENDLYEVINDMQYTENKKFHSNNKRFNQELDALVKNMFNS